MQQDNPEVIISFDMSIPGTFITRFLGAAPQSDGRLKVSGFARAMTGFSLAVHDITGEARGDETLKDASTWRIIAIPSCFAIATFKSRHRLNLSNKQMCRNGRNIYLGSKKEPTSKVDSSRTMHTAGRSTAVKTSRSSTKLG
jgi:hypothetical protein